MTQISAKIIGTGTTNDPYRVDLPNYSIVGEPNYPAKTCMVEVSDDELVATKDRPDPQKIRAKYRGQPKWDRPDVASDV